LPQIEVTFDIDANGILNVKATDKGTGKEQTITITSSSGLSKEEIDRMAKEGELHADEDRRIKEEIEVKNRADAMVYSTEKLLKEHRDKIGDADAKNIEAALEEAKKAIAANDTAQITAAVEKLTQASHKLAEAMYKQAAPSGAAAGTASSAGAAPSSEPAGGDGKAKGEGEVIDAEVVDDEKKKG
jgi:molecular chaperone DnaK